MVVDISGSPMKVSFSSSSCLSLTEGEGIGMTSIITTPKANKSSLNELNVFVIHVYAPSFWLVFNIPILSRKRCFES